MTEKLVFDFTMESMLRALPTPLTPARTAALVALGVDPGKPLQPAYPIETFTRLLLYIARERWPELPPDEASFALGHAFLDGYAASFMGRALMSVVKVIGPHRVLERMRRNFRSANNYTETRMEQQGPSTYELWFNYAVVTGFYRGLIHAGLEHAGAKSPRVEVVRVEGSEATFRISWVE